MCDNEDLGPLLVAPSAYLELRKSIRNALGFPNHRRPILIGIDGVDGSGKSSVASWPSWQLQMPAIPLDVYLLRDSNPISWRFDDLARAVDGAQHVPRERPVIVEGVLLLRVLRKIGRAPDFLVYVEKDQHEMGMEKQLESYLSIERPNERANYVLRWSSI
jgi:uridine kinase